MKIKVQKTEDMVIIKLIGCLNYESIDPFHKACLKYFPEKKVIFNLERLNFVGSSGITSFLDMMTSLLKMNKEGVRLCCVGSEFQRIFQTSPIKEIEIHKSEMNAKLSFEKMEKSSPISEFSSPIQNAKDEDLKEDLDLLIPAKIKEKIIDN